MPKVTDHDTRKKEILLSAIELYLNSATPVSSESLGKTKRLKLSSATIRNVLAELEEAGLLTHPHTSAGRLPTDEGYRYYINVLMKRKKFKEGDTSIIDKIYDLKVRELDGLLSETSQVMSDFTHYTSLVSLSGEGEERVVTRGMRYLFEHPEFHDIHKIHRILDALERKEEILELIHRNFSGSINVYIGKESNCPSMESCAIIVSRYSGQKKREGRLALIGPKRMAYDEVIPLMEYISEVMTRSIERY